MITSIIQLRKWEHGIVPLHEYRQRNLLLHTEAYLGGGSAFAPLRCLKRRNETLLEYAVKEGEKEKDQRQRRKKRTKLATNMRFVIYQI